MQFRPMQYLHHTIILIFLLVTSSSALFAQSKPDQLPDLAPAVRQITAAAAAKYKIPGIAIAVIDHGQISGIGAVGLRDKISHAPVAVNTLFQAGALGELVYAYAVLTLAADGRLEPGAPLTNYLPLPYLRDLDALSVSSPTESLFDPQFNQVTAIRVMNHTSGMPEWARNGHLSVLTAPGEKWVYSNEGYLYLQQTVARVTNEPLETFVLRTVFGPAQMRRSSFTWSDNRATQFAVGYDRSGAPIDPVHYARPIATATLSTTIEDYARFVAFLMASAPAQRAHESAISLMLSPTVSVESTFSWGLGCGLEKSGDDVFFFSRGVNPGFQSFVMASRKTGKGIVILTNSSNGLDAVPSILAATIGGTHPIFASLFLHTLQ